MMMMMITLIMYEGVLLVWTNYFTVLCSQANTSARKIDTHRAEEGEFTNSS